ncbi:AAA family ATPase [Clostridium sediminicola]|uniref:HelD family protein n=1 Tax=Clostridium sediminicola TaxID=3114879 RepID=UPI0031F209AD
MNNNHFQKDIEEEFQKQLQFEIEEDRANSTVRLIKKEILDLVQKRKAITDTIMKERQNAIDEYRDDEDKLIEYFDHERYINEETFRIIDRKLKELTVLQESPYFGKVSFKEEEFQDIDDIYIGRFGMTTEDSYEPVVVDWRAPIASLFYAGKLGEAQYEAPMGKINADIIHKRQFIIKGEKLKGMFDSSVEVKDDILQMVLSKNSGEKLKDIIMSIQAEQDNIIREDRKKAIVVDGVAGSGKTTIALHRIAYLLYNYRKILGDKVMILGPNTIFMEYISSVLPSLGEIGVNQKTFFDFAIQTLDMDYRDFLSIKDYMEKIINRDTEFINTLKFKTSEAYIDRLNSLINNLENSYFDLEDLIFKDKVIVLKESIKELFQYYKSMPLFRRSKKIKRILYSKIRDERDNRVRNIEDWYKSSLEKLSDDEKNFHENNLIFKRRLLIRDVVRSVMVAKESLSWLDNETLLKLYKKFNNENEMTIDDLAPILYLKIKLEGLTLSNEIKHVVIDEAQDYSLLQFIVIKELTKANGFTIVGDKNQRILPYQGEIAMTKLGSVMDDVEEFKLDKSYRSTKEIMEYANKYIHDTKIVPLVRNGSEVKEYNLRENEILLKIKELFNEYKEKGHESIAVITDSLLKAESLAKEIKKSTKINFINSEEVMYKKGTVIMPSYFAKGLEFDGVIIVNDIGENTLEENKLKYVMSTRALHDLAVIKANCN